MPRLPGDPNLRAHLDVVKTFTRSPHQAPPSADPANEFLRLACLTYSQDDPARWAAAQELLTPELARASLHAAAAAGDVASARAQLSDVNVLGGPHRWPPLLYLALLARQRRRCAGGRAAADRGGRGRRTRASCGTACRPRSPRSPARSGAGRATRRHTATRSRSPGSCSKPARTPTTPRPSTTCTGPRTTRGSSCCSSSASGRVTAAPGMPAWAARTRPRARTPRTASCGPRTRASHTASSCCWRAGVDPGGRGTEHPILGGRTALEEALRNGHTDARASYARAARASRASTRRRRSRPPTCAPTPRSPPRRPRA